MAREGAPDDEQLLRETLAHIDLLPDLAGAPPLTWQEGLERATVEDALAMLMLSTTSIAGGTLSIDPLLN